MEFLLETSLTLLASLGMCLGRKSNYKALFNAVPALFYAAPAGGLLAGVLWVNAKNLELGLPIWLMLSMTGWMAGILILGVRPRLFAALMGLALCATLGGLIL